MSDDTYVHGHHESVLRSHTWRTVENSAKYLESHLHPQACLLDVGCGPGTITIDFAKRLIEGTVLGIDVSDEIIQKARIASEEFGADNCSFDTGDTYDLDYEDNTFDIVHAHQLLQHLTDPVAAIREMRRVVRPGGIVALRDADYGGMIWAPPDPKLDEWMDLYQQMTKKNKVTANAGRHLFTWVTHASFSSVEVTSSTWTFSTTDTRQWWGGLWADRIQKSTFSDQVLEHELGTQDLLDGLSEAFRRWAAQPDGFFLVPHGEIIAIK